MLMVRDDAYIATGACAGCPYQVHCHEARQHAMDRMGIGRHTVCPFYREFERRRLAGQLRVDRPAPRPRPLVEWVLRLLAGVWGR